MRHLPRAVAGLLGAAVLAAPAAVGAAGSEPRLTSVVQASVDDLAPTRTYSAPYLLVDPANERNVVASAVEMRTRNCRLFRSTDAGQSWKLLDASPGLASYPFCFNTAGMQTETPIAWGRDSTLYYGLNGWDTQDGGQRANISVLLAKSTDLGDSWKTTIVRNTRGLTGAATEQNTPVSSVAVDTSGATDVVYVTWRKALPEQLNPPFQRAPMLAVSTDAGDTWSEPIDLQAKYPKTIKNATGQDVPFVMSFNAPSLATNDKGALFVVWPLNTVGITPAPPAPIIIGKTVDRGATWEFNDVSPPSPYTEHVNILKWSPAGGPQGSLHVIYEDKPDQTPRGADRDIYYQRSTDDGKTWTKPKLLNDDNPSGLAVQITPNIDVTPEGRVDAVWWDFRDDTGAIATDVYYSYSTDNGDTWSKNIRLTDRSVSRRIGVWTGADIRQPPGVASLKQYAIVGWDDTRFGDETTHTQDIFTRVAQFEALGAGSRSDAARYALGAMLGLAAVGIVLLVLSFVARRSSGAAAGPAAEKKDRRQGQVHVVCTDGRDFRLFGPFHDRQCTRTPCRASATGVRSGEPGGGPASRVGVTVLVRRRTAMFTGGLGAAVMLLAGAAAFACTNLATLNLSSSAGKAGDVITVTGSSYRMPSNVTTGVQIRWNALDGPVLAEVTPDKVGNISASVTIPQAAPDNYVIVAVLRDAKGADTSGTPSRAQFQIVGGAGTATPQPALAQASPATTSSGGGSSAPMVLLVGLGAVGLLLFAAGFVAATRTRASEVPTAARVRQD